MTISQKTLTLQGRRLSQALKNYVGKPIFRGLIANKQSSFTSQSVEIAVETFLEEISVVIRKSERALLCYLLEGLENAGFEIAEFPEEVPLASPKNVRGDKRVAYEASCHRTSEEILTTLKDFQVVSQGRGGIRLLITDEDIPKIQEALNSFWIKKREKYALPERPDLTPRII